MIVVLLAFVGAAFAQQAPPKPPASQVRAPRVVHYGYLDVGVFDVIGDGPAYALDPGKVRVCQDSGGCPDFEAMPWAFYGDPWANAVNSQGDSADLGVRGARAISDVDRYDGIASEGRPSFLVNRVHAGLQVTARERLSMQAGLNIDPRTGRHGRFGDMIGLDTAFIRWQPWAERSLTVYAGRVPSGFGLEYLQRHAPFRRGITPSIVGRYLVGPQTGVRVRSQATEWLEWSGGLTTGNSFDERFGHLNDDLDSNGVPTLTMRMRAELRRPVRLWVGASAQVGPQDGQPYVDAVGWQVGGDLELIAGPLEVQVEIVRSHQPGVLAREATPTRVGRAADLTAERLDALGGYVQVAVLASPKVAVLGRFDVRDADLYAWPNVYVSDTLRGTVGVSAQVDPNVVLKAEYLHLHSLRQGTEFWDDVLTTSVVFHYQSRKRVLWY